MRDIFLNKSIPEILNLIKRKKINLDSILGETKRKYKIHQKKIYSWKSFNYKIFKKKLIKSKQRYKFNKPLQLDGIPFGVKDIFNTKEFKTEMGSTIWKNFTPGNNARVVDCLETNGAIAVGKTVTAEYAVHKLNETKNPHNLLKTPGTSSSGSATAVCTGDVPFTLASQTAGSIIRPASFCGVWGMKPSFGLIARTGVLKTNDTLDTIGFITSNLYNLNIILDNIRLKGLNYPLIYKNIDKKKIIPKNKFKIGFLETDLCNQMEYYVKNTIENLKSKMSKNKKFIVKKVKWPKKLFGLKKVHSNIYDKSLSYYFNKDLKNNDLSNTMKEIIKKGNKIKINEYVNSLNIQSNVIKSIDKLFKGYDIIFTSSTAGSAVLRNEKELDDSSLIWTLAHIPSINIPIGVCPKKMPFGIQAISRKWSDFNLINTLEIMEKEGIIPSKNLKLQF